MDDPEISRDVRRINGFAEGDRVAITGGDFAGACGKVTQSWMGCIPEDCRKHCLLVHVKMTHAPPEKTRWSSDPSRWQPHRFRVDDVTHID